MQKTYVKQQANNTEKKATYLLEFESRELHSQLKSYCSIKQISMKDLLNELIIEKLSREE